MAGNVSSIGNIFPDTAIKSPVRAASVPGTPLSHAGLQTVDGVVLADGDRLLDKDQADQTLNGIWQVSTGNWIRPPDADDNTDFIEGTQVYVNEGAVNTTQTFVLTTTDDPVVIGTSLLTFSARSEFSSALPAATLVGNPAAATANASDFTLQGLVNLTSPNATLDYLLIYDHLSGTLKNVTPGAIASSAVAGVSSLGGESGVITLAGGNITGNLLATVRYDVAQSLTAAQQKQARNNAGGCVGIPDVIIEEQQASGTNAGSATTGSVLLRNLNTLVRNNGTLAVLATQEFTLPSGTYYIKWSAPAFATDFHKTRLTNVSDSAVVAFGTSMYAASSSGGENASEGSAVVTITASKVFTIGHQFVTASGSNLGMGRATTLGTEIYARVEIWALS